ncbi:hypothetical protein [Lichenihabitans psoromatis]|uniref:hypothetical protein n=1 Tax=Lichenihabitans psoromatis TaxID=2528642 RepID=UPI0010364056|nr:hypothetical protein [Lichenihabitans psoromatis]
MLKTNFKLGAIALVLACSAFANGTASAQGYDGGRDDGYHGGYHHHHDGYGDREMHHRMMRHEMMRHEMMRHEMMRHEMRRHEMHRMMRNDMND